MLPFLKLVRYKNLLMVLLTMVLTKYMLIDSIGQSWLELRGFIILSTIIIFITAAGYIINDIFDVTTDQINKPEKLYISTAIPVKKGLQLYWFLTLCAGILAFAFSEKVLDYFIFFGTPILLYLYSKFFKKIVFLGNIIISFLVALPIYVVFMFDFIPAKTAISAINNPIYYTIYFYLFFAFTTTIIREIIKDIEDVDGDLKIKAKTLPILFGRKRASKIAFFLSAILLLFLLIILQFLKDDLLFLVYGIIFILLPLLYFMYTLWFSEYKKDFSKLSNLLKLIMLLGILSMVLFKV
ncbi:MAG: 4-hydroxybenzoate polyprenyltransferase [Polaribacter sp.]|jgi:4-hydroxybenzoate polyprenyltransferase